MTELQQTHDAQKALFDLRDHLARHDKPIAFFFGAGTSFAVKVPTSGGESQSLIPDVAGLTNICREKARELGEKYENAWELIEDNCKETGQNPNVENILSHLRMMLSAVGNADTLCGLKRDEIEKLEKSVRETIAIIVAPDLESLQDDFPHRKFARWLVKTSRQNPVEIFTVNYDVLIEHALEAERIPIFDGFVGSYQPFFHPDSLRRLESAPGANWIRLWKMHGSITWRRIGKDGRFRIIRDKPNKTGEMIYPSFQKYDESRQQPYSAFTDRLARFLEQDDALLIIAGFSFGDEHINNLIFRALENRPRTHVYALQFEELPEGNDLVKRACQQTNMIVVGPETGIIGGNRAAWAPVHIPKSMEVAFELKSNESGDASEGQEKKETKMGLMKIGGFESFCDFLESMTSS